MFLTQPLGVQASTLGAGPKPGKMRRVAAGRASGVKTSLQTNMNMADRNSHLARAFPVGDARGHRRTLVRNGRRLPYQERIRLKKIAQRRERREKTGEQKTIRMGTLNVGSMTGRGHELVDFMERRKINILCVQETKWKGSKARELGNGFKLFYNGLDGRRNGVGIILGEELKKGVLTVKRRSDRTMWLKIDLNGELVNIMSAYAPQTGCEEEEKTKFWEEMDEEVRDIPESEKLWIGGDFNGHCGSDNTGKEGTIGKFGVGNSNEAGDVFVDFAMSHDLRIVNTYFKKAERHRITYKSGGRESQIDYIMCRNSEKGNIKDCKVILGESMTSQHRPLVCTLATRQTKAKESSRIPKIKWWKLAEQENRMQFAEEAKTKLQERIRDGNNEWETVTQDLSNLGEKLLGKTSGKIKPGKETWWWNEEVQKSIQAKKVAKKDLDRENTEENKVKYKTAKKTAKQMVAIAKAAAYERLYEDLDSVEGQKKVLRMARSRNRNSKDVYQTKLIKDEDGSVLVDDDKILKRWREYFHKLMNEENPRERRQEVQMEVNTEIEVITCSEVEKALKKMKNGKAVGPDNLPAEVWKSLGAAGLHYLQQVLNKIVAEEKIPDEWRKSTMIPIFKNKGDIMACGNYRGIKLMCHSMKLYERIIENRLRNMVDISEHQFGFMKGKSTTDAIFALRQLQEKYREGQQELHCVFVDLEKAYDRVPREELLWCMRNKRVPEKYIRLVKDMYHQCETEVKCVSGTSEPFTVEVGLHQGSALSPFLFAIIMDALTDDIRKETPWQMMFADDVVLCAREKESLRDDLEAWREALEKRGMKVSRAKTEYMCLNGDAGGSVKLQNAQLPEVTEFKYLGSTLQRDGSAAAEISRRVQSGWNNWKKMSGVLCDKKIPSKVKGKIYKMVVQPAMLYAMETLPVTNIQAKKLEVAEMKMCRWACGLTRMDHVRNEDIINRLKIETISTRCRKSRLRWFGHVKRREPQYVCQRVMNMVPPGRRKRGRPKMRWLDCVNNDLKVIGATEDDVHDRDSWRRVISATATPQQSGTS